MKHILYLTLLVTLVLLSGSPVEAQIIYPNRGGLGTSTVPSYGQIPVGNVQGTYTLTSTSSLGITGGGATISTDPLTATYFVATGTATSTFPVLNVASALSILGEYITDLTTWVRGKVDAYLSGGEGVTYSSGAISFDCSEVEGSGINCTGEDITLDATGDWTGTLDGLNGSDLLSLSAWYATTTDGLDEGSSNRYYTDARVGSYISGSSTVPHIGGSATGDILRWTGSGWGTMATSGINYQWDNLGGIPAGFSDGVDDTGDGFSTTSADYWETQQTPRTADDLSDNTTSDLAEGTNLYFTPARGLAALTGQNVQGQYFTATGTASSTFPSLIVSSAINLFGTFATQLSDLCVAITGGSGLCDGTDNTGGGGGLATSTPIADTQVIYGTSASDVGSEAAFTYDDATNKLTVGNASTTHVSATTFWGALTGTATGNDVLGQATSTLTSHTTTYNHANYDTAYGWGNHASQGYITSSALTPYFTLAAWYATTSAPQLTTLANLTITASQVSNFNATVDARLGATTSLSLLSALPGLVSFGSSSATTTALGNLAVTGLLKVGALNAADCDLKASTNGTFYCGTDAGVSGVLAVTDGGTGWSNIQAGNLLYGNGTGDLSTSTALVLKDMAAPTPVEGYSQIFSDGNNQLVFQNFVGDANFYFRDGDGLPMFTIEGSSGQVSTKHKITVTSASATSTLPQLTGSYLSGFGLSTCDPTTGKLTYANGVFGCGTDAGGAGTSLLTNSGSNTYLNTGTNLQAPTLAGTSTTGTSTITNALQIGGTAGDNALKITAGRNYSASNSVGGLVNLTNTSNTGSALVGYTTQGSSIAPLFSFRVNNATNAYPALALPYLGAGDALSIPCLDPCSNAISASNTGVDHTVTFAYTGTTTDKGAMNLTSTNTGGSVFQIAGNVNGLGVGKITHNAAGDADSSILSLAASHASYAGQGIFLDMNTVGNQKLLNLRADSTEVFTLTADGKVDIDGTFVSASTTGTNTFAGGLTIDSTGFVYDHSTNRVGIGTSTPAELLTIGTAHDTYATMLLQSGTYKGILFANEDDAAIGFGSQSNHDIVLTSNNTARMRLKNTGEVQVSSNSLQFPAGGTSGSTYTLSQTADDYMAIQRSGGDDDAYSLLSLLAPASNPQESTFATVLDQGSGNSSFTDWYTEAYPTDRTTGIAIGKRGTGEMLPFTLRFWNASLGNLATYGQYAITANPSTAVGIGVSTSTLAASGAAFLVASTTAPAVFQGSVGIGTTSPSAQFSLDGVSGIFFRIFNNAKLKIMEVNDAVVTLLGTWDFSGATVKQHVYKGVSWPPVTATTTTATSSVSLGIAMVATDLEQATCRVTSGSGSYQFSDGTNKTDYRAASTTGSRYTFTTNDTFSVDEDMFLEVGPMTNAQIICGVDLIQN